jgi:hypothetical protein
MFFERSIVFITITYYIQEEMRAFFVKSIVFNYIQEESRTSQTGMAADTLDQRRREVDLLLMVMGD